MEFVEALQNAGQGTVKKPNCDGFFLDPEFPRWKRLLEIT